MCRRAALGLAIATLSFAVHANYRCVGQDGKKYYGQAIPPQCVGMLVEQLDDAGRVVRRIEPRPAPQSAPTVDEGKLREEAAAAKRDRALLATYTSEAEIEQARQRALRAAERVDSAAVNARYDAELKRYRELVLLRENAPMRMEKGVRIIRPKPAPTRPPREPRQDRNAEEQAHDLAAREAEMLREIERQREQPRPGVTYIGSPRPSESSPPGDDQPGILDRWREGEERGENEKSPSSRPSTPERR